jgi:ring finger domain protein
MKSKKLLLTTLVALAVPFGTLSGGFVKAEGPTQPTTPAGTTPSVSPKDVDTPTAAEMKKAEDDYLKAQEDGYNKLNPTHATSEPLVNTKPEYKLPAAVQTPKKQVNPMNKNVKKALPKTSAVK